jgi:hypothetical protein
MFGFQPVTQQHFAAGLGGYGASYIVEQFVPGEGYRPLGVAGRAEALKHDRPHAIKVFLYGQRTALDLDDVIVVDIALPASEGSYLGFTAHGAGTVTFTAFATRGERPEAFIVMKVGEPFDTLYREVIAPVCEENGYTAVRADEFAGQA